MRGTYNLAKKNFLITIKDSTKFSLFLLGPRLSSFHQKINFPKIASNWFETLLLMRGTCSLAKNYFLVQFKTVQNSLFL